MGVVVEPGVSPEIAGLLRANAPLLSRIRSGWVPPAGAPVERPRRSPSSVILLAITPVIIALMAVLLETAMAPVGFVLLGTFVFVVLIKIASINEVPVNHRPHERDVYEHARRHDGRYFLPEDFDEPAGQVLRRAQRAIGTVLRSHVNAEGLLDDARNAVMLPEQEWEIARLLAKLSMLRAEHRDLIDRGIAPEVAAVVRPLQNALDVSEAAVVARVEALERSPATWPRPSAPTTPAARSRRCAPGCPLRGAPGRVGRRRAGRTRDRTAGPGRRQRRTYAAAQCELRARGVPLPGGLTFGQIAT